MRKNSEPARRGRLSCLALMVALMLPTSSLYAQAAQDAPDKMAQPVVPAITVDSYLGFARFVALAPNARSAIDAPNPPASALMDLASSSSVTYSPLAISLALAARSVLEVLPKPEDGGFILKAPDPDNKFFTLDEASLKAVGRIVFGLYSQSEGHLVADIYLVSAGKETAEKLGSYFGNLSDYNEINAVFAGILIPKFSNNARRIIDFVVSPQGVALSLKTTAEAVAKSAILVGNRLFIYGEQVAEVSFERQGFITQGFLTPSSLNDVYSIIHIDLLPDTGLATPAGMDFKDAMSRLEWKSGKDYSFGSTRFSQAMGRLVISLPVTALALGVFFLGYEGYSESAITMEALLLRGGAAALSVGFSVGFAVDTGMSIAGLISAAR